MKQAVSLRISVTDRCQLRCVYCMPSGGVRKRSNQEMLSFEEIVRFVRTVSSSFHVSKVRITGGEPLIRSGITELVSMLKGEGIADLALTTNAHRLREMAPALKRAGLSRVNVSLDSVNAETYARLTRGKGVRAALDGIEAAVESGLAPVKINTVLLRGYNDREVAEMARWAVERDCAIRFLELMPVGWAEPGHEELFVPSSEALAALREAFELSPLPLEPGGTSRSFLATDGSGRRGVVGLISSMSHPFCAGCARLRLTSAGQLIACLAHGEGPDIRDLLRFPSQEGEWELARIINTKLRGGSRPAEFNDAQPMVAIGG